MDLLPPLNFLQSNILSYITIMCFFNVIVKKHGRATLNISISKMYGTLKERFWHIWWIKSKNDFENNDTILLSAPIITC